MNNAMGTQIKIGRRPTVMFEVAWAGAKHKLELHEIDNCVHAALSAFDAGQSVTTAVEIGKKAVTAIAENLGSGT